MRSTQRVLRRVSYAFTAGAFGALINSLAVWLFGASGLASLLDVAIKPTLTHLWVMPRVAWGGLWGLVFLLIASRRSLTLRDGLIAGLFPTINMLLIVFPYHDKGMAGLALGLMTPLCVFVFNTIWGLAAAWWLRVCGWPGLD